MSSLNTHIPIAYLKGVGPARGQLLASELKLREIKDLLAFFPNRYIDKTRFYRINELNENASEVQIIGKIISLNTVKQKKGS
ncbi:ATP-dependent DNA helicase RecG, partial [Bacteroidota bacterium]